MNRNLIFIDKIKEIKELKTAKTNLARMKFSKYSILIPKEIQGITNLIHIRPGTVIIPNDSLSIHDFYYNETLGAHIIGSKYISSDNVTSHGLTIDPRRMNLNYNFKMFAGKAFPYADCLEGNIVTDFESFMLNKYHPKIEYDEDKPLFISKIFKKMVSEADDIYNNFISKRYENYFLDNGIDKYLEEWGELENAKLRIREHMIGMPFEMYIDEKQSIPLLILNGHLIRIINPKEREKMGIKEKFIGMNNILEFIYNENPMHNYPRNSRIKGVIIGRKIMNDYYYNKTNDNYQMVIFSHKYTKYGHICNLFSKNQVLDEITSSHNIVQKSRKIEILNCLTSYDNDLLQDFTKSEIKYFSRFSTNNRNVFGLIIDFILDDTIVKSYSILNNILFK